MNGIRSEASFVLHCTICWKLRI